MIKAVLCVCALGVLLAETPQPVRRLIWKGEDVTLLGGPSPDGKLLSFVDRTSGDLALRDRASGAVTRLTHNPPNSKQFAYFSRVAPDNKRVAYAWFNDQGFYDLRVAAAGVEPRVLYSNEEAGFVQPCAWSPDGKQILTLFFRKDNISQIALVNAESGAMRVLKSLNWVYPKKMDFSPDGRFIVYDNFQKDGGPERTIFALAVDGSRETKLVDKAGSHLFPLWSPDGRFVYYASDSSGSMNAWRIAVEDGMPKGEPEMVAQDLGRYLPLGMTKGGELVFGSRQGNIDVLMANTANPESFQRVSKNFPGLNSNPAFAPDGKTLAYLSRRGSENFGQEARVIVVRDANGEERELRTRLAHVESVRWSPDGRQLLASGSDRVGRRGLFRLDPASSQLQQSIAFVVDDQAGFRGLEGAWIKGAVLYLKNGQELHRKLLDAPGTDEVLYKAPAKGVLRGLAASTDGETIAVGYANGFAGVRRNGVMALRKTPLANVSEVHLADGLLFAGDGNELWRLPLDEGVAVRVGPIGVVSVTADGERIAFTAGGIETGIWSMLF